MTLTSNRLRLLADLLAELEADPDITTTMAGNARAVRFAAYLLADHRAFGGIGFPTSEPVTPSPDTCRPDWQHQCATDYTVYPRVVA